MKSEVVESYKVEKREIFNKQFGVIFDGEDNLKSLAVEGLIDGSPTASQCTWIYESFLGGAGFEVDLSSVNLSKDSAYPYTPNELLFNASEVISKHQGVFIHVGYNANFNKISFKVLPYTKCKLGKQDSDEYIGKIVYSKNGWGKSIKKDQVIVYDSYNPRPAVIQKQVDTAGGWKNYRGQVMYFKLSNKYVYAKSLIETAYMFADTENRIGMFYNATARRSFEDTTFIRHRKFASKDLEEEFYENIKKLKGFENGSSTMMIEDDFDDEILKEGHFRFDTVKNNNNPARYQHFETASANFIRKSFKNIPPQIVDFISGKLGATSSEDFKMACAIYNSVISRDQEKIENLFKELFSDYKTEINKEDNWTIKQYKLLDDGTVDYNKNPDNQM